MLPNPSLDFLNSVLSILISIPHGQHRAWHKAGPLNYRKDNEALDLLVKGYFKCPRPLLRQCHVMIKYLRTYTGEREVFNKWRWEYFYVENHMQKNEA